MRRRRRCEPDKRYRELLTAVEDGKPPADEALMRVYNVMIGKEEDLTIEYALDLIENPDHRNSLTAFFLSGATIENMSTTLNIPIDVLALVEQLCLDKSEFRNKLELRDYAEAYVACAPGRYKEEVALGFRNGAKFLEITWGPADKRANISEKDVLWSILQMSYLKTLAAVNAKITDMETREAYKWGHLALKTAPVHHGIMDRNIMMQDALVTIERRQASQKATDVVVKQFDLTSAEILH